MTGKLAKLTKNENNIIILINILNDGINKALKVIKSLRSLPRNYFYVIIPTQKVFPNNYNNFF